MPSAPVIQSFARLIDEWAAKLSPVAEAVGEVTPPPTAWAGIEAALAERTGPIAPTVPVAAEVPAQKSDRPPLLERLSFWRMSTAGALALAACLALYIVTVDIFESAPPSRYVALLDNADGDLAWLLTVNTDTRKMTALPVSAIDVDEKDLELWLVRDAETALLSVGLLHPTDPRAFPVEEAVIDEGRLMAAAFVVSAEPPGGSPTGLPTGPLLFQGGVYPAER